MNIQLSDHFTYGRLLRYSLPSILMMIFTSAYSIVDGFFVSNYVGKTPFAAVNLMMPLLVGASTAGLMLGTGGSAIVSMTLGQGKADLANRYFSLIVYAAALLGAAFAVLGVLLSRPAAVLLGAEGELLEQCVAYGRILFPFMPMYILQVAFQSFFVVAEKPGHSLKVTVAAGAANIVLDWLFVGVWRWGIEGAALATGIGNCVGSLVPAAYFLRRGNSSPLRLGRTGWYGRVLVTTCANGSSEMVSNLSASVVGALYNLQLMRYAGEDGVAAYGVMMYAGFVFVAIFLGYSVGTSPIVSYHYGAGNKAELHNMFGKGLTLMSVGGLVLVAAGQLAVRPVAALFTSYDAELMEMTVAGSRICILSFAFAAVNIWGSGFFTALNNGLVSALISFLRTLVFQVAAILVLPLLFGLDGVWFAMVAADFLAALVTAGFLVRLRRRYGY